MRIDLRTQQWWGAPKKFDLQEEDRRVSWLELFFDLVYVIAIARITHHFALHITVEGFFEYAIVFILIFWGWVNGSLYHDLHGNEGLRTRLMTLWQMMIIAAFAVVIEQPTEKGYFNIIIVFMIMQIYITYMWWSVGFYDRSHRKYNLPYTVLYLTALALMGLSLMVSVQGQKIIFPFILICNFAPPFISQALLRRDRSEINLSSSMFERLGLFTIIVFGELVAGVINGISGIPEPDFVTWLNFALAISIAFALWWIFFTLVSNTEAKKGFLNASLLEILYIPTIISLGLIAVSFAAFFDVHNEIPVQRVFGIGVATFLTCISLMLGLLVFPEKFIILKRPTRISLYLTAFLFLISLLINIRLERVYYLAGVILILVLEIIYLNSLYYRMISGENK